MTNPIPSATPLDEAALRESVKRAIFLQKSPADKPCALYPEDEDLPEILDTIMSICQRYTEQKAAEARTDENERWFKKCDEVASHTIYAARFRDRNFELRILAAQSQHTKAPEKKE